MQEAVQNSRGFVSPKVYRNLYIAGFVLFFIMFCSFFIWGFVVKEIALLILSIILILVGIFNAIYILPIFSKYYIGENIETRVGNICKKRISLKHARVRLTVLYSCNARNSIISQDKYFIIAKHGVDIDKVLHYTDKNLLKVLKTKDVIAIPENTKSVLYKHMIN